MSVQSLAFLAFLTVTVCVCRLLPKERIWVLLAASLVFYLWDGAPAALWGCGLLAVSSFASYLAANTLRKHRRKSVLLAVVCYHIAVLGIFKYTGFFTGGAVRMPLRALGYQLFHLPADLVSSGGLCRDLFTGPHSGRIPDLQLLFPHGVLWSHLEAGEFLPPAAGGLSPAPGYRSRFVRHRPRPCQKGAAGRTIWACW